MIHRMTALHAAEEEWRSLALDTERLCEEELPATPDILPSWRRLREALHRLEHVENTINTSALGEELGDLSSSKGSPAASRQERLDDLMTWLQQKHGAFDDEDNHDSSSKPLVRAAATGTEGGGGLIAARKCDAGDVIARVPRKAMITEDDALDDPLVSAILNVDALPALVPALAITLHLLRLTAAVESGDDECELAPYVRALPHFDCTNNDGVSIPANWDDDAIELLTGVPDAAAAAYKSERDLVRQYFRMHRALDAASEGRPNATSADTHSGSAWHKKGLPKSLALAPGTLTWRQFRRVAGCVSTRVNDLPPANGVSKANARAKTRKTTAQPTEAHKRARALASSRPSRLALVPLFDLANHDAALHPSIAPHAAAAGLARDDGALVFAAPVPCDEGEELRMFYGERAAISSLVHNGFVATMPGTIDQPPYVLGDDALLAGGDIERLKMALAASAGAVRLLASDGVHVCAGTSAWLDACVASLQAQEDDAASFKSAVRNVVMHAVSSRKDPDAAPVPVAIMTLNEKHKSALRRIVSSVVEAWHPSVLSRLRRGGSSNSGGIGVGSVCDSVSRLVSSLGGDAVVKLYDSLP